jgi:hypothetical protein
MSKKVSKEVDEYDIVAAMSYVDDVVIPSYSNLWQAVLDNVSVNVRKWVATTCRRFQVSSEMVLIPLLCLVGSILGNRIKCDYGQGKYTNLCANIVLAAPTNSRKSKIHEWISRGLIKFAELSGDGTMKTYMDGKITRAGLISTLQKNTNGRHSILLHFEEAVSSLDWFGRLVSKDTAYLDKVRNLKMKT